MTSRAVSVKRPSWNSLLALGSVAVTCVVLLGLIEYCPGYGTGKITLWQLFVGTFWEDLSSQIGGLFFSAPRSSLSGETTASEWNYCLLVPIICGGLIYWIWPKLSRTPIHGDITGVGILAGGCLLYVAGYLMQNYYVGMGSMELIYAGLIVLFLGWTIMRQVLFPWAFLMFMWPYLFMEDVALQLRLVMSTLSHHALQLLGVANLLNGTAIVSLPGSASPFAIDIADPCSGIRSFFALVMIAAVAAFVILDRPWQQIVLVGLAVPLVILGNLIRIIVLTLATLHFGEPFAIGTNAHPSWFHEGAGYLVYVINFGGLLLAANLFSRFSIQKNTPAGGRP